ncbi:SNAP25 homologous protein SNAP33 [Phalaenopsis equestris]|uniref:SNAP25 homologous protein SNAP33 n=1 Tax=Phalaenopsis equestris TaxID=78828 RepID=UPI0009E61D1B|nr:SNAP25 homologous protein SNAP33 [Phalaenopsis equestris]XP_020577165.1 SNAP25 homologous protein SNAP33 [Phalaenopsis equestris]XP_020577166.1 SNAP25 homologous protein SNAP33 [Phalaenopsis equestris]
MSRVGVPKTPNTKLYGKNNGASGFSSNNPFDSDSDTERNARPTRASSAPAINQSSHRGPKSTYEASGHSPASRSAFAAGTNRYENGLDEYNGFESQSSVQELEKYAVQHAEETTQKINASLKVAEEIREVSSKTLVTLHQQGEQITRTHLTATNIDQDLSRGERLLGSLGGLFSKTWKPKKSRDIKGPRLSRDDSFIRRGNHMEQRQKLGLVSPRSRSNPPEFRDEPSSALQRVEMEKAKQDDALSDLSNILGELKSMALDMGSEIERQNKALDHMEDDVQELNYRVQGANARTRRLLGR